MGDDTQLELELFVRALELPEGERELFLASECRDNQVLRQRVAKLLRVHGEAGNFLEESPVGTTVGKAQAGKIGERPGDQIGRYKLLEQIGEGGCGVVFMAEQAEPVRRLVALKVLKPGMDTKSVTARFELERQAMALMDHPNIAKVFDAGATASGRPYFVMELIRGIKITEHCDRNSLSMEERLKLFVQVCHAVQHAHQKGIIHRDIKPSNILVTTSMDGACLPVVIDFGIAKATTNQRLTDKTLFTAVEMLIGTPAYMSPEQAALTNADVDTRTDIYSLGVLLYELLTGSTPFDTGELLKAGIDEIRRVVREEEPVRPSARLNKMAAADLSAVARHRRAEPASLVRTVRGDLDWTVIKALEKDPTRRYATAHSLAVDIQRYLANEAISARPPSAIYKLRKTVARNKLLFLGIGLITAFLTAGLVVVSATLARERQAHLRAEREAAKSREVTQFLEDMLQGVGPSVALGRDTTMLREMLDQTATRVGTQLTNQPSVEAELRRMIGQLDYEIGAYNEAEEMQKAALAINRRLYGVRSKAAAESLNDLCVSLERNGKLAAAEAAGSEALEIRRQIFGMDSGEAATSAGYLAVVYTQEGRNTEAEQLTRQALTVQERLVGRESLPVADLLRSLSIILGNENRWAESEATGREVLQIRRNLLGPNDPKVATTLTDIAWSVGGEGKLQEAEELEQQALNIREKVLGDNHPDVAKSLYLLGDRMREKGDFVQARSVLSTALSVQRKLLGGDSPDALDTLHSLGLVLDSQGKYTESEAIHREAMAGWHKRGEDDVPQALSEAQSFISDLLAQGKFADARQVADQVLTPTALKMPACADLAAMRAQLEARQGQWGPAAADALQAYKLAPLADGRFAMVAAMQIKAGNRPAYERFRRELLAKHAGTTGIFVADQVAKACLFAPPDPGDLPAISHLADMAVTFGANDEGAMPFFEIGKALSEYRLGHFADAARWAQKSIASPRLDAHAHAYGVLAMAEWQLGENDHAREALAKAAVLAPRDMPAGVVQDPGNAWLMWLFARMQLDEAETLIKPGS